jgi:CTP:molybdopterin cytidylyltransferase MocA
MSTPTLILLAAGLSTRMQGADKLLRLVGDMPLLRRQALAALATRAPVIVTLTADRPERRRVIADLPLTLVDVADAAEGMGNSIAAGVRAARDGPVMILPADMPGLTGEALRTFLDDAGVAPDRIWRAMDASGTPGHPVYFPSRLRKDLVALTGDAGAKLALAGERVMFAGLPGDAATRDLDTPEAWDAFERDQVSNKTPAS